MAGMDVTARLTANTADFDSKMKASADVATRTAALTERASERARAAWQKEMLAQEKAAQRATEAGRAKELAALRSDILSRSLEREAQATEKAAGAAGHSVSQLQAVSAAARALEGNAGLRTFERFIASIPGASAAASMLFPAIGFATALAVVGKIGSELYETEQKGKHAGEEISRAFGEMGTKLAMTNDELELSNSKLADEIAKLEKHPTNGLQTALLEAVVAADKLQESLGADTKALQALLKEHDVSQMEGILAGVAPTGGTSKEITDLSKSVEKSGNAARLAYREQAKAAGDDQDKQEAATKAYYQRMDQIAADAARQMRKRASEVAAAQKESDRAALVLAQSGQAASSSLIDMTPQRASFEGAAEIYDEMQRRAQDSGVNFAETKKKGALDGAAAAKKDGDKAAEELLKSMAAQLNQLKLQYGATIKAQYDFWEVRRSQFAAGSNAYNQVVQHQAALAEEGARAASERIKRFTDEQRKDAEGVAAIQQVIANTDLRMAKDRYSTVSDTADAQRQLTAVQAGVQAKIEEQGVQDALNRSMTQAAAAAELARIHTREYGAELDRLQAKQKQVASESPSYISDDERAKQLGKLAEQIATLQGNRAVQQMQDARANYQGGTSGAIGATDALDELANAARDSAGQMRDFVLSTQNSINETILRQITGKGRRGDWTNLGQSVFSNVAGTALKKGEGALLSGLGFGGKADGTSQANALWVRMASSASSVGGAFSNVAQSAAGGVGSFLGKLGPILSNIPFFADGVDNFGGGMAVVGDAGPELLNLPKGSSVIPNSKAFGSRGGDMHFHSHVDARGATDPAQVQAIVDRSWRANGPAHAAATIKAFHESQRRQPSSKRA